jgi:zinc/manganese transport system permease protein
MIDLLLIPAALVIVLVMLHSWFGLGILQRNIIFTDLAIAQFAALGSAVSLGYLHGEHRYLLTLGFALLCAFLIAFASRRKLHLEAFIGLLYVMGASGIMMVLAHSAEGMEHFKSLLASDILFVTEADLAGSALLYGAIGIALWQLYPRLHGFAKELFFFSLLALTVTSSVQLAGVLVVFVLLIAPALVARMQRRLPPLAAAWFYGWGISIGGIALAFFFDLPTGYTLVFLGALATLASVLALSTDGIRRRK